MTISKKKYVLAIFISTDWNIQHRKYFLNEIIDRTSEWADNVIIQQPVCLVGHLFTKFKQKILGLIKGNYKTKTIGPGCFLFTPIIVFNYSLWLKFRLLSKIDTLLLSIQFNNFIKKYFSQQKIILEVFHPFFYNLLSKLKYDFLIYDYYDNFDYLSDGKWSEIDSHYNSLLLNSCDIVICSANTMYNRAFSINKNSYYIPNGNSFDLLSKNDKFTLFPDIFNNNKKIIGFIGNIRNWIDFELISELLDEINYANIVFIGYLNKESKRFINKLISCENFKWLPYMDMSKAAAYVREFGVGIIPFKINKYMEGVFPNKFFEYMAAGVPIVTTALKELEKYSDIIGYSRDNDEFISNCKSALKGDFDGKIKNYKIIAQENSWNIRADVVDRKLKQLVGII